jgi:hypothetical protein
MGASVVGFECGVLKNVAHLTAASLQSPISDVISLLRIMVLLRMIRKRFAHNPSTIDVTAGKEE